MAEIAVQEPNIGTDHPVHAQAQDQLQSEVSSLEQLCKALGMDLHAKNPLEVPDIDYLQHMARLPVDFTAVPSGTDVENMRRWIDSTLLHGPLAECRLQCDIKRRQPPVLIDTRNISVPCSDGSGHKFAIRTYVPRVESNKSGAKGMPAILMLHGGGWIHGKPEGDEAFSIHFASELRAVVLGIDYRLAPEHPYPAALDDCWEALEWVTRHASEYNIDPSRIGVWGASAGGNLAAALAIRVSRENRQPLRLVSLVVPVTAHPKAQVMFDLDRTIGKSQNEQSFEHSQHAPDAVVKEFEKLYELYTGDLTDPCDPLLSPLMAKLDANHPPTHVTVAACDLLKFQGMAYAQHLRSAGVYVVEEVLPGVPHGFTFPVNAEVTKSWLERQTDAFAAAFADESS
ncbi:hypothetical protein PV04_04668 [Phialophora macrospora]|uniref:Alpha/beta hydrolase fold-3 domain-containing protein n=1 Tax=Phialophora macrospora TaxID=1851006 RepID=A0A0D2FQA1_9EURO|nr:hypothetical protein PV04_04668 [Phialophora macrospora]